MTKKETPFVWTEEYERSFQKLKRKLTTAPILALPEDGAEFDVFAYASYNVTEAILMQKGKVIAYALRQLKDFERKYLTLDLELAVVVFVLKIWRHYLYRVKCNVYTNHKSLKYFFTQKELNMRQRWWLELDKDYNHEIRYHPRMTNMIVDV